MRSSSFAGVALAARRAALRASFTVTVCASHASRQKSKNSTPSVANATCSGGRLVSLSALRMNLLKGTTQKREVGHRPLRGQGAAADPVAAEGWAPAIIRSPDPQRRLQAVSASQRLLSGSG